MVMRRLVLASASTSRLSILRAAGFDPEVVVGDVNEDSSESDTERLVAELAQRKAESVAPLCEGALVIGCDSLLEVGTDALGKPESIAVARDYWQRLRAGRATLMTGHWLIDTTTGRGEGEVVKTVVHFGSPTDGELARYLDTKEPLESAGGFTLEGFAAPFVERIEGDALNVMGLSPASLRRLLYQLDVSLEQVWPQRPVSLR